MIRMILIISALIAGLILGPEISGNKGYILISFDSYTTYETTIINAGFIALIFYFSLLSYRFSFLISISDGFLIGWKKTAFPSAIKVSIDLSSQFLKFSIINVIILFLYY